VAVQDPDTASPIPTGDTTMYTAKDYDRALLTPSSVFEKPLDVVATDSLTRIRSFKC
jgi:hypothetical protein